MNGKCWLIGSPDGCWPSLLEQAASARGLRWSRSVASSPAFSNLPADRELVLAIAADRLAALAPADKQRMAERVAEGAMLYVKGGFKRGESFSMAPFANSCFSVADTNRALGWRLTDHRLLPRVIAKEAAIVEFESMTAEGTTESVEPILFVQPPDGRERPAIFTIGCGAGSVIYDLTTEEIRSSASLLGTLEDPATLAGAIGAVVAAGFALEPAALPKPSFNLQAAGTSKFSRNISAASFGTVSCITLTIALLGIRIPSLAWAGIWLRLYANATKLDFSR